jgi:hypothetical protein
MKLFEEISSQAISLFTPDQQSEYSDSILPICMGNPTKNNIDQREYYQQIIALNT